MSGSGVFVVHKTLESNLENYQLEVLSPYWGILPPALALIPKVPCAITHSQPELGPYVTHPDSELVLTFHNYYLDRELIETSSTAQKFYYRHVLEAAVRASLKRARLITAVSHFTADLVQKHHALGDRLVVIRNGVDANHFSPGPPSSNEQIRILFAGNPTRRKGAEHLVSLAQQLPENVTLQCTAGLRNSAVEKISATNKLVLLPRRSHQEMPELYRGADMLFFPTIREGLSLVVLEAMACGLPVVATRCSSMPELIDHGKGGFLFEPNNRGQMLQYLMQLAHDPVLRSEMGMYNREKILAEFTLEKMLSAYREVFSSCGIVT